MEKARYAAVKYKRQILLFCVVAALVLAWKAFVALTCPFVIYKNDPIAEVSIDGHRVVFDDRVAVIHPWKNSYYIEIRNMRGIEGRTVYPFDEGSDSGSITVGRETNDFAMKNKLIKPSGG